MPGLQGQIVTKQASMDNLPFEAGSFDIIWAEGCAFIIGIGSALKYWKKFLRAGGYLVLSDCTWFTDSPSEECNKLLPGDIPRNAIDTGSGRSYSI